MPSDAIQELSAIQQRLLNTLMPLNDEDCRRQFHDDLSPVGWHLMHTVFTENLWLHERVLNDPRPNEGWHRHYMPNNIAKSARGSHLPKHDKLIRQAGRLQASNRETLRQAPAKLTGHPLMKEDYLVYFLAQHHAMHLETIRLALSQKQIRLGKEHHVENPLKACEPRHHWLPWAAGEYPIGANHVLCFDNERRQHEHHLKAFAIGRRAVSNAEYMGFIESQGYRNKAWWSQSGWQWRQQKQARAPDSWRQDKQGQWYGHDLRGACDLQADAPVYGVNWHEACAYAPLRRRAFAERIRMGNCASPYRHCQRPGMGVVRQHLEPLSRLPGLSL